MAAVDFFGSTEGAIGPTVCPEGTNQPLEGHGEYRADTDSVSDGEEIQEGLDPHR
jgi:hypothetical protein